MPTKKVERIYAPSQPHMVGDGFRVHNFIPSAYGLDMERMDPFIFMDYNSRYYFSPTEKARGVGAHPHKGFETVTIAYQGKVAHHDSAGGGGIIGQGDVQWMTAASGLLHKEYHEENFSREGGDFQMVQLWVNLPAEDKKKKPKYQAIKNTDMTRVELAGDAGFVEIVAGEYQGRKGPASTHTPMNMMNAKLNKGGKADFSFPSNYNTVALVVEGSATINGGEDAPTDHLVLFENSGEEFTIEAKEVATVLVLSGEPIGEPIAAHGPFVMNSRAELQEAFEEFNTGKFGVLE